MSTKSQKKSKQKKEGVCLLTGKHGKFVAAHILPRALTVLSRSGEKAKEIGLGARPISRPATWYDNELVIQDGEKILEEIDTFAIDSLREHHLIWSSFGCDEPFLPQDLIPFDEKVDLRKVNIGSAAELRLFFLSVVWRAAASSRPEFRDVEIAGDILEDLRQRVLKKDPGNAWDYPIILDQLITRGFAQNRTPVIEPFPIFVKGSNSPIFVNSIRIYMDGLVAKVLLTKGIDVDQESTGGVILGASDHLLIFSRRFEKSRTLDNILEVMSDTFRRGYA